MNTESSPTAKQLIASWQLIWTRKLNGEADELKEAMASHVKLFPKGGRAEALTRLNLTISSYNGAPETVRALIQRGQTNLRRM